MKYLVVLLMFLAVSYKSYAQQEVVVPVYDYSGIKPFLHPQSSNDTVYVFNFWATWCAPCIKELPYFEQIAKENTSEKLKILLVSLDFKSEIDSRLIPFIKKRNINLPVVLLSDPDANSWIDQVDSSWTGSIPATLIVKGDTREFYEKSFTYDELKYLTIKFLKQ